MNGNPLQYSCLENPMDGGAWEAAVREVAKSQTRLSDFTSFHCSLVRMPSFFPGIRRVQTYRLLKMWWSVSIKLLALEDYPSQGK